MIPLTFQHEKLEPNQNREVSKFQFPRTSRHRIRSNLHFNLIPLASYIVLEIFCNSIFYHNTRNLVKCTLGHPSFNIGIIFVLETC